MFNNLTVRTRLFCLIGVMLLFVISLSFGGLYGMKKANDGLQTVYADRVVPLKDLKIIADMYAVIVVDTTHKVRNGNISWQEASKNIDDAEKTIKEKWDAYLATILVAEEKKLVDEIKPLFTSTQIKVDKLQAILSRNDNAAVSDFSINELYPAIDPISEKFAELVDVQLIVAKQEYEAAQSRYQTMLMTSIFVLIFGLTISIFIGLLITRSLMNELGAEPSEVANLARKIANNKLDNNIVTKKNDSNSLLATMKIMQQQLFDRITAERKAADESLYLRNALDNISSNVMVADNERNIIYMNIAVRSMLKQAEKDLQKALPQFDVSKLLGANVDTFHQNPEHSKQLLRDLNATYTSEIVIAGCSFRLVANPIKNLHGERCGTVVEWHNRTTEIAIEEEIANIVYSGADCGDFSVKMTTHDKAGFNKRLAELINKLFITTEKSLKDVLRVSESLADGDLTQHIEDDYVGAFAAVKVGMNMTVENLKNLLNEIKDTTEVIACASDQISEGNHDLSHRTEEQAASLEETAASMEELALTVQANTENAKHANELAVDAYKTAQKGVDVVNNVVSTMVSINESSHRIVDIVSVIDDIAFQTNILALNAAVEAARAGEQGKGFAVVAVEVRSLAQRAANAAAEVKQLIGESVERVNGGSKQVEEAGKTMEEIVDAIQEVSVLVSGIATASVDQHNGIDQVHEAIISMDGVTQQNAALVEEAAAAAGSLSEQTRNLVSEMAYFKTGENEKKSFDVDVKKAQSMQQRGAIIIDVRDQNEWDSGYIANAIHIPLNEIKQRIFELSSYKNHSLILQCRSGGRSIKAIDILKNAGFSKLYNMTGGLTAWTEMGLPLK